MKINADVIDSAMLKAVKVRTVMDYLTKHGFSYIKTLDIEAKPTWLVFTRKKVRIDVPADEKFADYDSRIFEIIDRLASLEKRTILEVYCDLIDLPSIGQVLHRIFEVIEKKALNNA